MFRLLHSYGKTKQNKKTHRRQGPLTKYHKGKAVTKTIYFVSVHQGLSCFGIKGTEESRHF